MDPGERFGGYRIVRMLGHGGTSVVYLADEESLGRRVALKILYPQWEANTAFKDRFLREAQAAARVFHPNTVALFACGEKRGLLYMAFEYVAGGDLYGWIRDGRRLPETDALRLLHECVQGLRAIAEAGLVHRDIKPHNIYLGENGQAKLGDLGLARSDKGDDHLTLTGAVLGTPAFMSPEQALGKGHLDIRSDIYSLGSTFYALLTGRLPFEGDTPFAVTYQLISCAAPPRVRAVAPRVSVPVDDLIARMMAKDPDDRFRTALELLQQVEALLGIGPGPVSSAIHRRLPRRSLPRWHRWRRLLAPVPMGVGVVIAVLLTVSLLIYLSRNAEGDDSAAGVPVAVTTVESSPVSRWRVVEGRDEHGAYRDLRLDGDCLQRFRLVPAGEFFMGSLPSEEGHQLNEVHHSVILSQAFWIGDTECTQYLWWRVMDDRPASFPAPDAPVESVSWTDSQTFLSELERTLPGSRFRLPTEAEWEYACRAGGSGPYGHPCVDRELLSEFANYADRNSSWDYRDREHDDGVGDRTAAVKRYRPNAFGLYGMHGNVSEWVADAYAPLLRGSGVVNPLGEDGNTRVHRGGSWLSPATQVRSAFRMGTGGDNARHYIGFRFVLVVPPAVDTGVWRP